MTLDLISRERLTAFALTLQLQLKNVPERDRLRVAQAEIATHFPDVNDQNLIASLVRTLEPDAEMAKQKKKRTTTTVIAGTAIVGCLAVAGFLYTGHRDESAVLKADENGCYNAMAKSSRVTAKSRLSTEFKKALETESQTKSVAEYENSQRTAAMAACDHYCSVWAKAVDKSEREKLLAAMISCLDRASTSEATKPQTP